MRNNFIIDEENEKYPWSFGQEIENIIRKDIKVRYSLIRYFYSQLFLISLNEKGGFFKPVMFEFPEEKDSYFDIENRIMLGDSILICPFFDNDENDKDFIFPNSNWNKYPSGENIINYFKEKSNINRKVRLSGKKEELHIFLRGGYIIPMQDTFWKYIMNTYYLRFEKLNLIINLDQNGQSKGTIFFDNDEPDTLQNNKYIRVELEFRNKILNIKINHIKENYIYKDDILNSIEIWRINEIYNQNIINKGNIILRMKVKNKYVYIKGIIDKETKKMIIFFNNEISLFDLKEINMNC
jgi:alpha-glucosidase (family GH31 glycosyl hydrolase)